MWEEENAEQGAFFGRILLLSVYTGSDRCVLVLLVSVGSGLQGRAAIATWQSSTSLVNGPCVVIQNAAGGVLEKGYRHFQTETVSKAQWLIFNIYRYFTHRTYTKK